MLSGTKLYVFDADAGKSLCSMVNPSTQAFPYFDLFIRKIQTQ